MRWRAEKDQLQWGAQQPEPVAVPEVAEQEIKEELEEEEEEKEVIEIVDEPTPEPQPKKMPLDQKALSVERPRVRGCA
eukprot:13548555-Alexandrium_andersonii.AAC.1